MIKRVKGKPNKLAAVAIIPIILLSLAPMQVFAAQQGQPVRHQREKDWTYGVYMFPTISGNYDAIELVSNGLIWSTAPTNGSISWWTSSSTSGATRVFAQDGMVYNGLSQTSLCTGDCTTSIPANSWGLFYEWNDPTGGAGTYHGDDLPAPTGWNAYDQMYFSIAAYPSKGELSFQLKDGTNTVNKWKCSDSYVVGTFSGNVTGVNESGDKSITYGDIHMYSMSNWDEVISTGQRNTGNIYLYTQSGGNGLAPSSDHIQQLTTTYTLGWQAGGTHPTSYGALLWTNSASASNENVPADHC